MEAENAKRLLNKNGEIIPDWAAGIGLAVMVGSLALTAWASVGRDSAPPTAVSETPVTAERLVTFTETSRDNGRVVLHDAETGALIAEYTPEDSGFIGSLERVVAYRRQTQGIAMSEPFRLTAHADGKISFVDTATGQMIDINAFGPGNTKAAAALF
ncbi:MAG: photosynthetic complex assembly protein PuhC [Pseudomonadota bacterium]